MRFQSITYACVALLLLAGLATAAALQANKAGPKVKAKPVVAATSGYRPNPLANAKVGPHDWNQWAGSPIRNNTPEATNIPTEWEIGDFDDEREMGSGFGQEHQMGRAARIAKLRQSGGRQR